MVSGLVCIVFMSMLHASMGMRVEPVGGNPWVFVSEQLASLNGSLQDRYSLLDGRLDEILERIILAESLIINNTDAAEAATHEKISEAESRIITNTDEAESSIIIDISDAKECIQASINETEATILEAIDDIGKFVALTNEITRYHV